MYLYAEGGTNADVQTEQGQLVATICFQVGGGELNTKNEKNR